MSSLKALTPVFAKLLRMSPLAVYERQRALVRAGLLQAEAGRGPGSGVRATPENAGLLLLAILTSEGETGLAERVAAMAQAPCRGRPKCPISGATTFSSALTWLLSAQDNAHRVDRISLERTGTWAMISYKRNRKSVYVEFGGDRFEAEGPMDVEVTLDAGRVVPQLAFALNLPLRDTEET